MLFRSEKEFEIYKDFLEATTLRTDSLRWHDEVKKAATQFRYPTNPVTMKPELPWDYQMRIARAVPAGVISIE